MLTQTLEFELTYDPEKSKLLLIDYDPPRDDDKPLKLAFTNVVDTEGIKTAIGAWINLKEDAEKNRCKTENG